MARRPQRDEAGETLVELVIAMTVLGLLVVGLLGGLAAATIGSRVNRDQATAQAVASAVLEHAKDQGYQACLSPSEVLSGFAFSGYAGTPTVEVYDWTGGGFLLHDPADTTSCATFDAQGHQQKLVKVTVTNGSSPVVTATSSTIIRGYA